MADNQIPAFNPSAPYQSAGAPSIPPFNPDQPYQQTQAATSAPSVQEGTISATPPLISSPMDLARKIAFIQTNPIAAASKALDAITNEIENYTQEGRAEHPILAHIGDVTRNAKELLEGGQSVGKPQGTKSGLANNPITTAISLAPGVAEVAPALIDSIDAMRAARAAKAAETTARATQALDASRAIEVPPENFVYREPTPAPQHGSPVETPTPLDDATLKKMPGGKDLSPEARNAIRQQVGGEAGQEIPVGSSAKNIVHKASAGIQRTIADTGVKMADLIQKAPKFGTSVAEDGAIDADIQGIRDNLPGGLEENLNKTVDKELKSANDALNSNDPSEILAYRQKLGSQIDWNNIVRNPETPGEVQNLTKVKLYNALGTKIHSIPGTADLDAIFQPNLEARSFLDKNGVSREPAEANAEHVSELNKGKTQIENDAHNAVVRKNRALAGLPTTDVEASIGLPAKTSPIQDTIENAVSKFKNVSSGEKDALRNLLRPSVKAGRVFGTNTSWFDGLKNFDSLTPEEQAARFSDPAAIRQTLRNQATKQIVKTVAKYGSIGLASSALGLTGAALHLFHSLLPSSLPIPVMVAPTMLTAGKESDRGDLLPNIHNNVNQDVHFVASDGSIHSVPATELAAAKSADPGLQVIEATK